MHCAARATNKGLDTSKWQCFHAVGGSSHNLSSSTPTEIRLPFALRDITHSHNGRPARRRTIRLGSRQALAKPSAIPAFLVLCVSSLMDRVDLTFKQGTFTAGVIKFEHDFKCFGTRMHLEYGQQAD